ncbi:hypothetical protein [Gimesia maris]|uniref:Transposase n=1 Tax=Gimesia maris TaxID=122 RepID=A0ABX5YRA4_9PLAN|nr:hypothetical protein [Gimesia maris]EDL59190.1 hypothetical protein PM8797T_23124 [Gimesia maris DSM 8797]QEG18265.1 hypothetical protein GmarT_41510 [Gimesia maris]QGQ28743.1 hypothetical protein F1729_08855 [Gimesia maris]
MRNVGKDQASMLQTLEVSESTSQRWRNQYGGMKSEEAKRLKQLVADLSYLKWGVWDCITHAYVDTVISFANNLLMRQIHYSIDDQIRTM